MTNKAPAIDVSRRKPTFTSQETEIPILDIGGLNTASPKPPIDRDAVGRVSAEVGFTQSVQSVSEIVGGEGRKAEQAMPQQPPAAQTEPDIRARRKRSTRTVSVFLKATPTYHEKFLTLCDQASEAEGRIIAQVEMFERMILMMEQQQTK